MCTGSRVNKQQPVGAVGCWLLGRLAGAVGLMTTKASLFLPGREMRTKKWPTTMTVAVAMVDGDDDDGDRAF